VADIRARKTFAYDINADGTLGNKTPFADSGSDGMTIDSEGNVYVTSGRAVVVFDKTGQRVERIAVPEAPSNICFGGKGLQTLFITARTGLYAVKTQVHGVGPQ
jgi:gluconolactonase